MANATKDEPTKVLYRKSTISPHAEHDVQSRIFRVMAAACAELSDELRKHDLEFVAYLPDTHYTTRVADFRFQHVSDKHEIGFLRAIVFTPVIGNDTEGHLVLKGFTIHIQLYLDSVRESVTVREDSLLQMPAEQERFKQQIVGIVRAAVKKWAS